MAGGRRVAQGIVDDLRAAIEAGQYAPGAQLPSRSVLAKSYGVAELTISHAMSQLRNEGLIVSRAGAGSYVREHRPVMRSARARLSRAERDARRGAFVTDAHTGGWTARSEVQVRVEAAGPEIAAQLGIGTGEQVLVRDRVMSADDVVVQLATSYLPAQITTPAMAELDTGPGGLYARLEEAGHRLDGFEETVRIGQAGRAEAETLGVPAGTPVFRVVRAASTTERVVEVNHITLLGDRFELFYDLPAQ